jgi:hypothetical protein
MRNIKTKTLHYLILNINETEKVHDPYIHNFKKRQN